LISPTNKAIIRSGIDSAASSKEAQPQHRIEMTWTDDALPLFQNHHQLN